ncbi:MAG: bifunctional heptose 7-phosphate kinase/heptose 1-phosphate adenyltransferase, partial [Gammaproteobacteria bacterium]
MLERFGNVSILIVGDVMLDRFWWGDVTRISPEAPVPVVRLRGERFAPGGAANVAANVTGLGAKPVLLGAVGADPEAAILADSLSEIGIDPSNLFELPGQATIVKTRIVAHSQQVVRVDREERLCLTPEQEAAISERSKELIADADVVLVSD